VFDNIDSTWNKIVKALDLTRRDNKHPFVVNWLLSCKNSRILDKRFINALIAGNIRAWYLNDGWIDQENHTLIPCPMFDNDPDTGSKIAIGDRNSFLICQITGKSLAWPKLDGVTPRYNYKIIGSGFVKESTWLLLKTMTTN